MDSYIEQAKVMPKGQITIPQEIRKLLGLGIGDRVSFIVNGDQVILANSSICALKLIQQEMTGEAEKAGLRNEDDVQKLPQENYSKEYIKELEMEMSTLKKQISSGNKPTFQNVDEAIKSLNEK